MDSNDYVITVDGDKSNAFTLGRALNDGEMISYRMFFHEDNCQASNSATNTSWDSNVQINNTIGGIAIRYYDAGLTDKTGISTVLPVGSHRVIGQFGAYAIDFAYARSGMTVYMLVKGTEQTEWTAISSATMDNEVGIIVLSTTGNARTHYTYSNFKATTIDNVESYITACTKTNMFPH